MTQVSRIAGIVLFVVASACGTPPQPTVPAPVTQPTTAAAPTEVPTATVAPSPTVAPTPTSAPGTFSSAAELGLPPEFASIPKDDLAAKVPPKLLAAAGLKEDEADPYYAVDQVHWFQFPVKASFGFVNGDNTQFVYGYTVALTDPKDQSGFDSAFVAEFFAKMRLSVLPWTPNAAKIKDLSIGDKSSGVTAQPKIDGFVWSLNAISFRVGDTGAVVFTLYPGSASAPIDIVKLAQAYQENLAK